MAVTAQLIHANVGEPVVLHSTSWRTSRGGVVLTFVAVVDPAAVAGLDRVPVGRVALARGDATTAPSRVDTGPVVEHGLRHLAWLVRDDPAVAQALPSVWDVGAQRLDAASIQSFEVVTDGHDPAKGGLAQVRREVPPLMGGRKIAGGWAGCQ